MAATAATVTTVNRLGQERSLYLRQHQDNPVEWYPWGDEAFERAGREDRPVLLSVGYSTCHWCHVMARESFSDPRTAAVQNRLFVSIKVDREERPDVDRVYMEALQALTGSGGWPMTVFLLPDGRPYFAGTYFPPTDRGGLPSFRRVMEAAAAAYRQRRTDLEQVAEQLTETLKVRPAAAPGGAPGPEPQELDGACERLLEVLDPERGGFRGAPRFPQASLIELLLGRAAVRGDGAALEAARLWLRSMAEGGIHDQLGGGFHRYSVDSRWAVPHFEKMLYDQAQLISTYLHLAQHSGQPEPLSVSVATAEFLITELALPQGGFAAALDADTAGAEGSTYVWTARELDAAAPGWSQWLRLDGDPGAAQVLQARAPWGGFGPKSPLRWVRDPLLTRRRARPQPARDEKLVVGWNGLAAAALAELFLVSGDPRHVEAARAAALRIREMAGRDPRRLPHVIYDDGAGGVGSLEDRAASALAALRMHEATGESIWFEWAQELATAADELHRQEGPIWFDSAMGSDHRLAVRPITLDDGAVPSGTSLMVELCWRLHGLTGDGAWMDRAEAVVRVLAPAAVRSPAAFGRLLLAAEVLTAGPVELALSHPLGVSHLDLLRRARHGHRPQLVVAVGVEGDSGVPALARDRPPLGRRPTAYVCRQFSCRQPTADPLEMEAQLDLDPDPPTTMAGEGGGGT